MPDPVPVPVDRTPLDLAAIEAAWLQVCGACDAGMLTDCTHPDGDYRPVMAALVAEVERLRNHVAELQAIERTARELLLRERAQRPTGAAQ